jgi:hypothetical protein
MWVPKPELGNQGISDKPITMNQMIRIISGQFVLGCVFLTLSGCSSLDLLSSKWNRQDYTVADENNPAVNMFCAWEPVEGTGLDGMPTRGFAGQILFFNRHDVEPVVVEGDVRIYLFDDVGTPSEQAKPIRQFDFKGQAWNIHANQTTLGPSYNIFLPYTRENYHYLTNCALRLRLIPNKGPTIFSNVATVPLPGPKRPDDHSLASGLDVIHPNAADSQFQTHKQNMQHVEQMVKQFMHSQKSPARTRSATPHLLETEHSHILSQSAQTNTLSVPGPMQAGRVASVDYGYGLTPEAQARGQVQPIATEIDPVESRFNYYQTEHHPQSMQRHPIQQGHPLNFGSNRMSQSIHPLSPNRNSVPAQQYNRLPTSNNSHPIINSQQGSSRRHPLGQLQQHPLEGFSSQYVPTGGQNRLQPTVSANAAPANATNWNLRPRTLDTIASGNSSMDRRLSFVGR